MACGCSVSMRGGVGCVHYRVGSIMWFVGSILGKVIEGDGTQ